MPENAKDGPVQQVQAGRHRDEIGELIAAIHLVEKLEMVQDVFRNEKEQAKPDEEIRTASARQSDHQDEQGEGLCQERIEDRLGQTKQVPGGR